MGGITSAIITTTLVFMAVFIPVSMMGGTSGTFYMQFGLTMAAAVGISAINALTLLPALCKTVRADLYAVGQEFIAKLQERPEIGSAYTTFNVNFPQYLVEVDAAKCQRAGTTADAVLSTLAGYYSGQYVSNFNRFNKLYRVMIQSSPEYRVAPESLDKIFTRTGSARWPRSASSSR